MEFSVFVWEISYMWIIVLGSNVYHMWTDASPCVYTALAKIYTADQLTKESHNSNNTYLIKKTNRNRSDPFTYRSTPGSVLKILSGELVKRFMRAEGAMQFGCCFTRFQLGALSHRPYTGEGTGERGFHVQQGAPLNAGPGGSFGLILNDLLRCISL